MKILAIETSCDETAVAVLEAAGDETRATYTILGDALYSQIDVHREYGGVFPTLAKREHANNLVPLMTAALEEAEMLREDTQAVPDEVKNKVAEILEREPELDEALQEFIAENEPPELDAIAVTYGPGLEPALWVGVNFARALSLAWGKPVVAVNHMEGHILAGVARKGNGSAGFTRFDLVSDSEGRTLEIGGVALPMLALLISGGHTELVLMKEWLTYEMVGQTRDDAVGEAFDKVARMLGLPYPGGPEISRLAEEVRDATRFDLVSDSEEIRHPMSDFRLPRPMIDHESGDFSFAGLKTAVLYLLKNNPDVDETEKKHIAREFEDAAADVLWKKTKDAIKKTGARTLVIGGGVSANAHTRRTLETKMKEHFPEVELRVPSRDLSTDNAVMIGLAGFYRASRGEFADITTLRPSGNLSLANKP